MASKSLLFLIRGIAAFSILTTALAGCAKQSPTAPAAPTPVNSSPEIMSLTVNPSQVGIGQSADVVADARDADGDALTYTWQAELGSIFGSGNRVVYSAAGCCAGTDRIHLTVKDSRGAIDLSTATVTVGP